MKFLKLFLVFIVVFSFNGSKNAFAGDGDVSIFFANGMFNDFDEAEISRLAIEERVRPLLSHDMNVEFSLAYNHNEEMTEQLREVVSQKTFGDWVFFLDMLSGIEIAPDWLFDSMMDLAVTFDALTYLNDDDLQRHIEMYQAELDKGNTVIVVSHSQGNFYANAAYDILNSGDFTVVSVASPSSFVAGDGDYTTSTDDAIINAVRSVCPLTLLGNVTNESYKGDAHAFEDYLNGDVSGPRIISHVLDVVRVDSPVYVDLDLDDDGYSEDLGDCDDSSYYVHPGAEEVCDGVDNNCDGVIDEGCVPNAPTNLTVDTISLNELVVSWDDNSNNEDGFEIMVEFPTSSGSESGGAIVYGTSVNVTLPLSGSWWKIWVWAFNDAGYSEWAYIEGVSPSE